MNITTENIELKNIKENFFDILINGQNFNIILQNSFIPFGIEIQKYNNKKNYFIKVELNQNQIQFFKEFEQTIGKLIDKDLQLKTQITYSKNFKDKLTVKIKTIHDKFQLKCFDKSNEISVYDIIKYNLI